MFIEPCEPASIDDLIARIAELEESLAGRRERLCVLARRPIKQRSDALRRMRTSFAVFEFRTLVEIREGLSDLAEAAR